MDPELVELRLLIAKYGSFRQCALETGIKTGTLIPGLNRRGHLSKQKRELIRTWIEMKRRELEDRGRLSPQP